MFKNLWNRILNKLFDGLLIEARVTDPVTNQAVLVQRFVSSDAFALIKTKFQQEIQARDAADETAE